jgi:DNA-binding NarL/FixJ family response regulator
VDYLPDFLLMDIRMKNMSGLISTSQLTERFPEARVIIISDYYTTSFKKAAISAGAIAFFSKDNIFEVKRFLQSYEKNNFNIIDKK